MANFVIIKGNIGNIDELRRTATGKALLKFSVATTKRLKDGDKTTWHRCQAWEGKAETIEKYFSKGKEIYIQGEIDNDSYEDKEGKKVYTSDIIVDRFEFCGNKSDQNQPPQNTQGSSQNSNSGSSWGNTQGNNANGGGNGHDHPPNCDCHECVPF